MADVLQRAGGVTRQTGGIGSADQQTILGDGTSGAPFAVNQVVPPFPDDPVVVSIFARPTGSDVTGDGTLARPYATLARAVRDVPTDHPVEPGQSFLVSVDGISEVLPANFELPCWKAPETLDVDLANRFFLFSAAVAIEATPRLVQAIPAADCVIAASDILSVVQDAVTQLVTITLVTPRASWAGNALRGKFAIGAVGGVENAAIWESTNSLIRISATAAPTTPIEIMEPSAVIAGTSTVSAAAPRGALNAINCDSIAFNGLDISTVTVNGFGLAIDGNGLGCAQLCRLGSPAFFAISENLLRILCVWIYGRPRLGANLSIQQGLLDQTALLNFLAPGLVQLRKQVVDLCAPIDLIVGLPGLGAIAAPTTFLSIENSLVRRTPGATGDGVRFHGVRGRLSRVDIYGCGRDGIRADSGAGFLELLNVRTTGAVNAGIGVNVTDGLQIKIDAATSGASGGTQLRGTGGEMKVGTGATRTWANFVSGGDGRPALNEFDVTAAAATGATGTGTRLSQ